MIIGLGYVGLSLAVLLAQNNDIIAIDVEHITGKEAIEYVNAKR